MKTDETSGNGPGRRLGRRALLGILLVGGAPAWLNACGRRRGATETESPPAPTAASESRSSPPVDVASREIALDPEAAETAGSQAVRAATNATGTHTTGATHVVEAQAAEVRLPTPTPTPIGATLPGRLVIPRIDLDIPVVELGWSTNRSYSGAIFSEWDVAPHAAGWHKNSALPGQRGNVVMSGHNNILGAVFRQLDQLRRDDEITVYSGGRLHLYRVERVLIVPERHATDEQRVENAQWIAPTPEERLTLVSCWPRNDNTHRIIVVARPVSVG